MLVWCVVVLGLSLEVVLVAYVDAMVVCMLKECEGDCNTGVSDGGGVVEMSAGHEYVGGTHGLGIVSNAAVVLGTSVVRGIRVVGGVCEMCMCLAWNGV